MFKFDSPIPFRKMGLKMDKFIKRLKLLRKIRGLKQKEVADYVGIKRNTYSDWENGKTEPSLSKLWLLADLYSVPLDWLIGRMNALENHLLIFRKAPKCKVMYYVDLGEDDLPLELVKYSFYVRVSNLAEEESAEIKRYRRKILPIKNDVGEEK